MLPGEFRVFISSQLTDNAFDAIPVTMEHALSVYDLPLHHRDPFDRILIAQSKIEGL